MVSKALEEASAELDKAHKNLLKTQEDVYSKGPKNVFCRHGYSKFTTFALKRRLRFERKGSDSSPNTPFLSLPFSDFASKSVNPEEFGAYLDEIELHTGKKGNYRSMANFIVKEFKEILKSNNDNCITENLNISPKELLLIQLCGSLQAQANNNLLFFREHYRYPDDKSSIVHLINMFPLKLLLTPRDFLVLMTHKQDKNGTIYFVMKSLNKLYSETKGCVRGKYRLIGMKIVPIANGCQVTYYSNIDVSIWVPRISFNEYLNESAITYFKFCEATILQLRRNPSRLKRLMNDYLRHLKSVEFNLENETDNDSIEDNESDVEELRKLEQELDAELAEYSSDSDEVSSEDEYDDDDNSTVMSEELDLLSLTDSDIDEDFSSSESD